MNLVLVSSLKHQSIVKISTLVRNLFNKQISFKGMKWQEIEDKILKILTNLPLPESLKNEVLNHNHQLLKWLHFHYTQLGLKYSKNIVEKLCWTSRGTIDKKKSAEVLVQENSDLDLWIRFKLACVYCLDSRASIHQQLLGSNADLRKFRDERYRSPKFMLIVLFFFYSLKGNLASLSFLNNFCEARTMTVSESMFRYSAVHGFDEATKFFFEQLNFDQQKKGLIITTKAILKSIYENCSKNKNFEFYRSNVLCFLLCKMDVEERLQLFKSHPFEILISFSDTPLQYFSIEILKEVLSNIKEGNYNDLITTIIRKIIIKKKQFDYSQVFRDFWCLSPASYKKYVIDHLYLDDFFLESLFDLEDKTNIKLFFNYVTIEEKEKIIFSYSGKNLCARLIELKKYELFELLLKLCLFSSKETMSAFKEKFKDHILRFSYLRQRMWNVASKIIEHLYSEIP